MNETVNRFLLVGDKFIPEMHLKQPRFTYSPCGPFTKNKERIQKFKETGDTNYIYKNELDKACFQRDMAYGDFKDLARRTKSEETKHFILKAIQNMMDIKKVLHLWFINFSGRGVNNEIRQNRQLAKELHKPVIRKCKKKKSIFTI